MCECILGPIIKVHGLTDRVNRVTTQARSCQLEREVALARAGGDEELLREIAALFLDDYPHILAELKTSILKGAPGDLEHHAHSLKGSVANFGARDVVAAAFALEQRGRRNELDGAEADLHNLQTALDRLKQELKQLTLQ